MTDNFKIEVLSDWNQALGIKDEWDDLNSKSEVSHPFTTFEWFDSWYRAYCNPEDARIILLRNEDNTLRTIFPGMFVRKKKGGIPLNCFSYAGNRHSPKYEIISHKSDTEAIKVSISAIWKSLHEKIDIAIIENVDQGSPTYNVLTHMEMRSLSLKVEHSFESPAFNVSEGWNAYLKTRSRNYRDRLHKSVSRSKRLGGLEYDIITDAHRLEKVNDRLKLLDSKTWQHKNGTGLFSTDENNKFYTNLIKTFGSKGKLALCFVQLDRKDISYSLGVTHNTTGYLMKAGYDPAFKKFSPGFLSDLYLSEWMSSSGLTEIDMLGDLDDYKKAWETHRRRYSNCWLVNKKSFKSNFVLFELSAYNFFKKAILIKSRSLHKPRRNKEDPFQEGSEKE